MARGRNRNETQKVQPTISAQQAAYLDQLVEMGDYGNTPTAVALYLIQRGLDDMLRAKLLDKVKRRPKKR